MNLWDFEAIDWDDDDDENGNSVHCAQHGVTPRIVDEVLRGEPVEIKMKLVTSDFAVVGPDNGGEFWTLLFDRSYKRGDWLRPVTGWVAEPEERNEWKRGRGRR